MENGEIADGGQQDTLKSDINLVTLERNSFNFLEYAFRSSRSIARANRTDGAADRYAKMQQQTLPKSAELAFDTVVPKISSTRHVAASAFYHCLGAFIGSREMRYRFLLSICWLLVLATKNLLSLRQAEPYESITIEVI